MTSSFEGTLQIRAPGSADATPIAALSTQLGYPSSPRDIERRLQRILPDEDHAVYVAVNAEGEVTGWIHAFVSHLVESDPVAEIGGLVVSEAHWRCGIGRLLMQRAERWALAKGVKAVYLRSNVIRKGAHAFYQRLGYTVIKTQFALLKTL